MWADLVKRYGKDEAACMLHERAAIREYCGNQGREEAEEGAWGDLEKRITARELGGVAG